MLADAGHAQPLVLNTPISQDLTTDNPYAMYDVQLDPAVNTYIHGLPGAGANDFWRLYDAQGNLMASGDPQSTAMVQVYPGLCRALPAGPGQQHLRQRRHGAALRSGHLAARRGADGAGRHLQRPLLQRLPEPVVHVRRGLADAGHHRRSPSIRARARTTRCSTPTAVRSVAFRTTAAWSTRWRPAATRCAWSARTTTTRRATPTPSAPPCTPAACRVR